MKIVEIVSVDKRKQKIVLDNDMVFVLYNRELKKYDIQSDGYIESNIFNVIMEDVLYPRAKERALYIIGGGDKTIKQLKDKLKAGLYPEEIIDRVIEFLVKYNYVDDKRYALSYINAKKNSYSRKKIEGELIQKGISREVVREALAEQFGDSEKDTITLLLKKNKYKNLLEDDIGKKKVIASLVRKGFDYEIITRCIKVIGKN